MESLIESNSSPIPALKDFNENLLLFLLAAFQFNHVLDFVIMMPLGPQFVKVFQITSREFGLLVAAYSLSAGLFSLVGSVFIDRLDRRTALLILFTGFTLGTFFCAISNSYIFLLLSRIFAGAFGGILGALVLTTIGDAIPEKRRGKATGIVMSAFSVSSVVGIPLGIYLAHHFHWQMPFFFLVGLSAIILAVAFKYLPSMRGHIAEDNAFVFLSIFRSILTNKGQKLAISLAIILQIAGFLIIPYFAQFMVFNVGIPEGKLTYIYLCGGLFSFFTSRIAGVLTDRYGSKVVFIGMTIFSMVPTVLATHLTPSPMWVILIITTLFFIFNGGRFVPAMTIMTGSVEPQKRGGFMSITSSLQQLASGIASYLGGLIVTQNPLTKHLFNFEIVGYFSILAAFVCIIIVFFLPRTKK